MYNLTHHVKLIGEKRKEFHLPPPGQLNQPQMTHHLKFPNSDRLWELYAKGYKDIINREDTNYDDGFKDSACVLESLIVKVHGSHQTHIYLFILI